MNAHNHIRAAKIDIERIVGDLNHFLGDDEQFRLDMLEGETALFEVVGRLLDECEADEGIVAALDKQIDERGIRAERAKARIEARKKAIASLMDCAAITKLPLPEATLSLRTLQPRPKVVDAEQLPPEFVTETIVRKPNLDAIKEAIEAGQSIAGVTMTNGGSSLTVRRK